MKYGGESFLQGATVVTTSKCNRHCKHCMVRDYMLHTPNYELTIGQFKNFLNASKDSGYVFDYLAFTGGDPLLWEPLWKAVDMAKKYEIAKEIDLFTNGIEVREENMYSLTRIAREVDRFNMSFTGENQDRIDLAKRAFGHLTEITVWKEDFHFKQPEAPVRGTIPAQCRVNAVALIGDQVFVCANVHVQLLNFPEYDAAWLYTDVEKGFLDRLDMKNRLNKPYCEVCVSNCKIESALESFPNTANGW